MGKENYARKLDIGRKLPKSYGYYEWCEYHKLDPETLEKVTE